jgi:hypothetical protein
MASPDAYQLSQLYQKAVPSSFFEEICREQDYHFASSGEFVGDLTGFSEAIG